MLAGWLGAEAARNPLDVAARQADVAQFAVGQGAQLAPGFTDVRPVAEGSGNALENAGVMRRRGAEGVDGSHVRNLLFLRPAPVAGDLRR